VAFDIPVSSLYSCVSSVRLESTLGRVGMARASMTFVIMPGSRLCRVLAAYLPKDPTIPKKENKARVDHSE